MPSKSKPKKLPPQKQSQQPGIEKKMSPLPETKPLYPGQDKLKDKVALITGGDSGIGKAVALRFAAEGASVAIVYLEEHDDALKLEEEIDNMGGKSWRIAGDISKEKFCRQVVEKIIKKWGRIDILVNNAAVQFVQENPEKITSGQMEKTFRINVFAAFYFIASALPHMKGGSCIINTSSVTAYRGSKHLIDYAATKGALISMTRSLSSALAERHIRVNAVAPGPVWTPLIPASFDADQVAEFGQDVPLERPGQPNEIAGCFLFLASDDASYMTGQVLHPNGGEIING